MFNLKKKVKEQKESAEKQKSAGCLQNKTGRISVRDKLLTQGDESQKHYLLLSRP